MRRPWPTRGCCAIGEKILVVDFCLTSNCDPGFWHPDTTHRVHFIHLLHICDCSGQTNYLITYDHDPAMGGGVLGANTDKLSFAKGFGFRVQSGELYQRLCCLLIDAFARPVAFIKPKHFTFFNACGRQNVHLIASCLLGCTWQLNFAIFLVMTSINYFARCLTSGCIAFYSDRWHFWFLLSAFLLSLSLN